MPTTMPKTPRNMVNKLLLLVRDGAAPDAGADVVPGEVLS